MALTTISEPAVEPITASDGVLRELLSLVEADTGQDTLIDALIAGARDQIETFLQRRLITQTVRLTLDGFSCCGTGVVSIPVAPVQSVDQVQYMDDAGTWQTMSASDYRLIDSSVPPVLSPAYGEVWPVPRMDRAVVRIDLVVGYGDAGTDVPPRFLSALRTEVAHRFFADREGTGAHDLCPTARAILAPSVVYV